MDFVATLDLIARSALSRPAAGSAALAGHAQFNTLLEVQKAAMLVNKVSGAEVKRKGSVED